MKAVLLLIACLISFASVPGGKKSLICHKWHQVGIKAFGKEYTPVDNSMAENLVFNPDGTYSQDFSGTLTKGKWKFNRDSSKLAFAITEMNGNPVTDISLADAKAVDSIILLNEDTLIYGRLAYYGKQKVYGHEDSYFVRAE